MFASNNYPLRKWLYGDKDRRKRLLKKLMKQVQMLGCDKRTTRAGLIQLTTESHVVLSRLSVCSYGENFMQSADTSQTFIADKSANVDSNMDITSSTSANCENNHDISPEKYQKNEKKLKQILSLVNTELKNTLQECSLGLKNESNVCSLKKTNSIAISDNIENGCREVSVLMKETDVNLKLVDHSNTPLRQTHVTKNTTKMNIKKITRKRLISKKSFDRNVSATQMQKKSRGTVKKIYEETLNINAETSNNETRSDNKLNSMKQINLKSIGQEERETESIRLQKRQNDITLNNRIKYKRAKLHKYFRDTNDPDTSESEEERKILFNYLKRKTQQSDDSLYKVTTNEIKNVLKQNKILLHDTSVNNLSKDIKSSTSLKLKSGNSCNSGSTKKCSNYSSITDEETEDEASVRNTSVDNLQRSLNRNSDDSCNSTACTEKCFSMCDKTTDESTENEELIYKQDISAVEKTRNIGISIEIKSANSNDPSECIKKCYAANDATTENNKTLIPSTRDTSFNNSPINVENAATSSNVESEDSCNSSASTVNYNSHYTTNEDVKNRALLCKNGYINNSQDNDQEKIINVIPVGTKIGNSCDSTTNTKESNAVHESRTKKMRYEASICTSDKSFGNSKKIVKNTISTEIKSNYLCDSTVSLEERKNKNKVSLREHDNLQESTNSAKSVGVKSDDLNDSTRITKKYTRNNKIKNRASSYKYDTVSNNSQEKIKNGKVVKKEQYIENSSLIASTKNNTSNAKSSNDIPFTTKINFEKNNSGNINLNPNVESKIDDSYTKPDDSNTQISLANQEDYQEVRNIDSTDLTQCENVQNHVTSVSKLPIVHTHKSTCNINEKNTQNVKNLSLTCNDIFIKDGKPIEQLSVITSTSETISSERNSDGSLSVQTIDLSSSTSISNDSGDDHSLDDDNNDIEIQIQIKPKQKHQQAVREISLKAPWSAVNTCIDNLNTLKEDPALLNKFFNMGDKISGKSTSKKSLENNTSLNNIRTVTIETEHCDIRYDSSPVIKNNESDPKRQNFQEKLTLNVNKNTMDSNKEEEKNLTQSVIITTKNNIESNKLVCNMSDLEQLQETEMKAEQAQSVIITKNNVESNKLVYNMPDLEQLQETEINAEQTQSVIITTKNNVESNKLVYNMPDLDQLQETEINAEQTQSVIITTKNNVESNKLVYNMPDLEQLQETEINAEQEINKKQKSPNNTIVEEAISVAGCKGKENVRVSSIEQEDIQGKTIENSTELVNTACTSNVKKQSHTSDNAVTESSKPQLQSTCEVNNRYTVKSTNLNTPAPSENAFSTSHQSVPPQSSLILLPQSVPQSTPQPTFQSEPQSTLPQSMYSRTSSFQLTLQQSYPQLSVPVIPFQILSTSSVPLQIVSSPTVPVQTVSSQRTPPQVIPPNVVVLPKVSTLGFDKLLPISSPYNANVNNVDRPTNVPLKTNASVQINNQNNQTNLINTAILDLSNSVNFLRTVLQETSQYNLHSAQMITAMKKIINSLNNLQVWLNTNDVNNVISYINKNATLPISAITLAEIKTYYDLVMQLRSSPIHNKEIFNMALQYSNFGEIVPNQSSMPSVNTQSVPRPAPKKAKMPKKNCGPKIPRSTPKVSNINQQQLFSNSVNSSYLHSHKQPMANVQQYTSFTPSSHMQNTNFQQFEGNANNSVQGPYIPSTNALNGNAQYKFINNNVPPSSNISYWASYKKNVTSNNTTTKNNIQDANVNQLQANSNQQAPLHKQVGCSCHNCSNQTKHTFVSQSQYNIQTQFGQNIQANQNAPQTLQQKLKQRSGLYQNEPTSSNANNTLLHNLQQKTENFKSQGENCMQRKASTTSLRDLSQRISNACNVPQNTSGKTKTTLPEPSMLQQSSISLQEENKVLTSISKSISKPNNTPTYIFDLSFLRRDQKVMLYDQINWFLFKNTLNYLRFMSNKSIEQLQNERIKLFYFFDNLYTSINNNNVRLDHTEQNNIIEKSNTSEKCAENNSQNDTLQNKSVLQESVMQISVDEFAKIQSNKGNKNLETQSLKQSVDSNTSENSKSIAINSSKTQNEKLLVIQKSLKLTDDIEQQKQNNDNLKKTFQESVLVDTKKQPEISKTFSPRPLKTSEENVEVLSITNSTKTENNIKIDKSLKAVSLYDEKFLKMHPCLLSRLNLSHDALIKETKDQSEITKSTVNEKSNNVKTKSAHDTSNVIILNINKENNTTQFSHNIMNQNKEIHNTSTEIPSKNLQDKMSDNANGNNSVLNQLNVLDNLVTSLNNTEQSISPMEKCTSSKMSQVYNGNKKYTEILSNCSKSPQQTSTKEEDTNANKEICDGMSDCSEKLYIDENMEERQESNQCDEALSSNYDDFYTLHRVDSPWSLDVIKHDPSEIMPILLLANPIDNISQDIVDKTRNATTFNGESEGSKARESTFKYEDEWNMEEDMEQVEATKENDEQLKAKEEETSEEEVSLNLQFSEDELNTQDSSIHSPYFQRSIVLKEEMIIDSHDSIKSENDLNTEENTIQLTNRELPKNIEEQNIIDTHSNIRTINEQLKHISEQKPGKSQTHSLNCSQQDNTKEEIILYQQSHDICDTNIECTSMNSEDSEITTVPSILNVQSIPPSLFEKIGMDKHFEGNIELDQINEKSLDVTENLGNPDNVDDYNPCLRCKSKSTVICETCLKAHYCSKRCSLLHWKTKHYKECERRENITYIEI